MTNVVKGLLQAPEAEPGSTQDVGSIRVWAIHYRGAPEDSYGSLSTQNILWKGKRDTKHPEGGCSPAAPRSSGYFRGTLDFGHMNPTPELRATAVPSELHRHGHGDGHGHCGWPPSPAATHPGPPRAAGRPGRASAGRGAGHGGGGAAAPALPGAARLGLARPCPARPAAGA